MYGLIIIRERAPRPPKYYIHGTEKVSTSSLRRLDLILWYTSGFT